MVRLLGAANYSVKPYSGITMGAWRLPAPLAGTPGVGVMRFPEGMASGSGPASTIRLLPTRPKVLDLRFDLAHSPNWYGNTSGISKIMFVFIAGKPMAYPTSFGQAMNNLYFRLITQNMGAGHDATTSSSASYGGYAAGTAALIPRGKWRQIRLLLVANTPGKRDGQAHGWIDGVQIFSNKAVGWCGSTVSVAACGFDAIRYNPTYGGSGGPVPATQYMYLAGLEAYGR